MHIFSLLLGIGAVTGLSVVAWQAAQKRAESDLDAGLATMLGALVGGRIAYVAVNWDYFQYQPQDMIQVWLGGLSGVGALAGAIVAIGLVAYSRHIPWGSVADTLLPLGGCIAITAWLACWIEGSAYGEPSTSWWALPAPDEWGALTPRQPVQLMGALLVLGLYWLLEQLRHRLPFPGLAASILGLGLSAELFGLSFLRADPIPVWLGLRLEAWGAVGMAAIMIMFLGFGYLNRATP